jgi:hypothetical protein
MRLQESWNDFSVDFAQKQLACINLSSQDQGSLLSKSMMIPWIGIGTMPSAWSSKSARPSCSIRRHIPTVLGRFSLSTLESVSSKFKFPVDSS